MVFDSSDNYFKGDISLPIDHSEFSARYLKYFHNIDQICYLDNNAKVIRKYSSIGKILDTIDLKRFDKIDDFFFLSKDSVYITIENQNKLILINGSGSPLKEYIFNLGNKESLPFYTYNYKDFPLVVDNNLVFLYHYFENETLKENLPTYYSKPRELIFNLEDSLYLKNKAGKFPGNYIEENYNEMNPFRTIGKKGDLIYSFEASDSIFIYNREGKLLKPLSLNNTYFERNPEFDESKIHKDRYFDELEKYLVENDKYGHIMYNESNGLYFRTLKKGMPYANVDGTKNLVEDCQWLLIMFNEKFEIIKIFDFKPSVFSVYSAMIINDNKFIIPYLSNQNETKFAVFDFNK